MSEDYNANTAAATPAVAVAPKKNKNMMYIAIAVGAVVVIIIACVIGFLIYRSKHKKVDDPVTSTDAAAKPKTGKFVTGKCVNGAHTTSTCTCTGTAFFDTATSNCACPSGSKFADTTATTCTAN